MTTHTSTIDGRMRQEEGGSFSKRNGQPVGVALGVSGENNE